MGIEKAWYYMRHFDCLLCDIEICVPMLGYICDMYEVLFYRRKKKNEETISCLLGSIMLKEIDYEISIESRR